MNPCVHTPGGTSPNIATGIRHASYDRSPARSNCWASLSFFNLGLE
ncbi:hypothetical protein [Streptomyces sp. NBC_00233]|nr:hypothetical protein [Streptomyces sp. NBC_00233]MCX5231448.1 hypothetical protein [Streptomyces sp. NBC_00233]MCX5233012.1 hypothetical protein [Streptomyces sp. NBC_00233]